MKVYIVQGHIYEGKESYHIASTYEKAKEFLVAFKEKTCGAYDNYSIDEWEIDSCSQPTQLFSYE